ncbi:MAG: hypothetical protein R3B70_17580 [Polyangiaceae bacterium]
MPTELTLPTDPMLQILTGAVFAESSTRAFGGESHEEKEAIAWAILNMSHYATVKPERARRGYNTNFGDGTVLGAIRSSILAYESPRWRVVMNGLTLKPQRELSRLVPGDHEHLRLVLLVTNAIGPAPILPGALATLGNRIPVQFNQANDSPPNPARQEKIGRLARHTFYAFKVGREAE